MTLVWMRLLKSLYRREPVVSFLVTIGLVDAIIGGFNEHWSLLTVGLGTAGVAIAVRLWQLQRRHSTQTTQRPPVYILPPQSSRPSLPLLSAKKNPPGSY